ncbi:protein PSK SIMULATOR 1-like isoform X1 [Malus sylvestris]|uniref:protein PSK SIMULATOR 1-like isoform X1 n=1 Tax=Malus sylvestris TaxID=3752 RepID=UPI0021AD1FAB|nr:protein PSK SIMULATOR 1-like isoform X1 [Malus sylvestris]
MGGILNMVKKPPKVQHVDIVFPNNHHEYGDNGSDKGLNDAFPCFPKRTAAPKVSEASSLLGWGIKILDKLGSGMKNLSSTDFVVPQKGNKISILAFEVVNTIVKGGNLMQSLSEDNIRHLKEVVLPSKGVQTLISTDMDELLRIAASDKREELKLFIRDVVRFGNYSKDPTFHNLDLYFKKIGSDDTQQKHFKKQAQTDMKELMALVQSTAELCHESHLLEKMEQDYLQKHSLNARRGDLEIARAKQEKQVKLVSSLKNKSLWSKTFEEVVQKLVDVVHLLHVMIHEAFGSAAEEPVENSERNYKKLGPAGIALHYASIISQINTLVSLSRSSSVAQKLRDTLYQGLPSSVTSGLRSKLQLVELTIPQIKAQMGKTLEWLVPVACNTTKALHNFGWVGEWENAEFEARWKHSHQTGILMIETLHHADKAVTEAYICQLIVWLHHLMSQAGAGVGGMPSTPVINRLSTDNANCSSPVLTHEDQEMLQDASKNNLRLGMSKSQNYDTGQTRFSKRHRLSKSCGHSLASETRKHPFPIQSLTSRPRPIDFDIDRIKLLDVIDGLDTTKGSK